MAKKVYLSMPLLPDSQSKKTVTVLYLSMPCPCMSYRVYGAWTSVQHPYGPEVVLCSVRFSWRSYCSMTSAHKYIIFPANSYMLGSLRLTPISIVESQPHSQAPPSCSTTSDE